MYGYPFSGEAAPVTFRAKRYLLSEIIGWFGDGIQISDVTEDELTVRVTVDLEAMRRWAVQYAVHAWVLGPERLEEAIKEDMETAAGTQVGTTQTFIKAFALTASSQTGRVGKRQFCLSAGKPILPMKGILIRTRKCYCRKQCGKEELLSSMLPYRGKNR